MKWLVRDRTIENPKVFDVKFNTDTFTCQRCQKKIELPADSTWDILANEYPLCSALKIRPPRQLRASRRTKDLFFFARRQAAYKPLIPPPIIRVSTFS